MKFTVSRTSDYPNEYTIEVNTLEEFMNFVKLTDSPIIVNDDMTIEIYDDYRE